MKQVGIKRRTEKMGHWRKGGERPMKSPKETKGVNQGQRKGSEKKNSDMGTETWKAETQK